MLDRFTIKKKPLSQKSTVQQIRQRFDEDVERFSNIDTGHEAAMDSSLMMDLTAKAALAATPHAEQMLDIGCGAGNYTLKVLQSKTDIKCDLVDLSANMLKRAHQRVSEATTSRVRIYQGDIREVELPRSGYDIIIAAAVLHHFRNKSEWQHVFEQLYRLCAPGGGLWISDLICHESPALQRVMENQYCRYLEKQGGVQYRKKVMAIIDQEDSPQTVPFQLDLLRSVGFTHVEVLHKNACYAAFGALKEK